MFILRQVFKSGGTQNVSLGNRYQVVKKQEDPEEFKRMLALADAHPDHDKIFAIMFYDRDQWYPDGLYPLYRGHHYYVMTPEGKTFEHIKP